MNKTLFLLIASNFLCTSALAAHIVADTRSGSTLIKRTHTYANAAGDLRIDEQGFSSSATMSADAAAGSQVTVKYEPGKIDDTTIFQTRGKAIVSLEGKVCRRMTADSAPPPGLGVPGADMRETSGQLADVLQQAGTLMEQAMTQAQKDGMSPEQQRALNQLTQSFGEGNGIKPRDTLQLQKLNRRVRVGRYSAEGYLVTDLDGVEKHRVWVVPASSIDGGTEIRRGYEGMLAMYAEYLDKMGGGALLDTGLAAMFSKEELAGTYPVRTEDLESGEITDVVEVRGGRVDVEFYPDCEVKDMFGM